jgi:hypothetical protein
MLITYAQSKNKKISTIFQCLIIIITFFCILLSSNNLFAAQVRVIFDRSSDSRVDGYKFFYGKSKSFNNVVDLGKKTEYTTPSLEKGTLYYFAAKAYDKYGNQSPFSEIVSYKIPTGTNTSAGSTGSGTGGIPTTFSELNENFQNHPVGSSPSMWLSTKANNSMVEDKNLFKVFNINKNRVFGTTSTLTNIHSHSVKSYVDKLSSFEYSGRMMMTHQDSGIGVTFLSHYPFADNYYRLMRSRWTSTSFIFPPILMQKLKYLVSRIPVLFQNPINGTNIVSWLRIQATEQKFLRKSGRQIVPNPANGKSMLMIILLNVLFPALSVCGAEAPELNIGMI